MIVRDLGLIEYSKALEIQQEAVAKVLTKGLEQETLLVCEHPTVITLGRALGSEKEIFSKDLPVFEVSRGGRSTLHLPGQVVVYPILNLEKRGKDLHAYMRLLEEAIIQTLADFRVQAERIDGKTGVWIKNSKRKVIVLGAASGTPTDTERKIASLGIAVKKWVSYHGLALNVDCDLKLFSNLNPCGFSSDVMTSLIDELDDGYKVTWAINRDRLIKNVKTRLLENLQDLLNEKLDMRELPESQNQGVNQ